ncbi:MAG: FlgO family outer membrane protein [Desulfobacterales bacterium]|nr:FlgO family outer membrane protein [Desulfobacterales bacterium]
MQMLSGRKIKTFCVGTIVLLSGFVSAVHAGEVLDQQIKKMAEMIASEIAQSGKTSMAVAKILTVDKKSSLFGTLVAEKLTNGLVQESKRRYSVKERSLVDRIMGENVELSAADIQQKLAADVLITGTFMVLENEVEISVRAIDLATAQAIAARSSTIPIKEVRVLLTPDETGSPRKDEQTELTLSLQVLAIKTIDGVEREILIKSGDTLYSRDQIKVNLKVDKACFLYVLYYNSTGEAGVLFPNPKIALDNNVAGGKEISLPGENLAFELDENTGTESLYFVASLKPMDDVSNLLAKMEKAGSADKRQLGGQLRGAIGTRGFVTTSLKTPSDIGNRKQVMDVIKGKGSVLKVMEIIHR